MIILSILNITIFLFLSFVHFYWAAGGKWGFRFAVPTDSNGKNVFTPGILATTVVAFGLLFFALINLAVQGEWFNHPGKTYARYMLLVICIVFFVRAIGDAKYIGAFKRVKRTPFARRDRWLFTPLCFLLALTHLLLYIWN